VDSIRELAYDLLGEVENRKLHASLTLFSYGEQQYRMVERIIRDAGFTVLKSRAADGDRVMFAMVMPGMTWVNNSVTVHSMES
jgi:hypothetical protein